jgi:hypothetical protein
MIDFTSFGAVNGNSMLITYNNQNTVHAQSLLQGCFEFNLSDFIGFKELVIIET